jgi:hypothetical protein
MNRALAPPFDYFGNSVLASDREARASAVLRAGPWCWPTEGIRLTRALQYVPEGPPPIRPGEVLLVTYKPDQSSLFAFKPAFGSTPPLGGTEFLASTRAVWDSAAHALPHTLPLTWRSIGRERSRALYVEQLFVLLLSGRERAEVVVDGPSFGLSFLLSLISLLIDRAIPARFAASAELDGTSLLPVGALAEKIGAVVAYAPRVTHFLVAAQQANEARRAAQGSRLRIVPVETSMDAVRRVFRRGIEASFSRAGSTSAGRAELISSLMTLTRAGQQELWPNVRRTAELLLTKWSPRLDAKQLVQLRFVAGVAGRHANNDGSLPALEECGFDELDDQLRLSFVAHYLQQSADRGTPESAEIEAFARRHANFRASALPDHLVVQGALARLLAVTGRADEALVLHEQATSGFENALQYASCSFPLAQCFRLAGALERTDVFDRADAKLNSIQRHGSLGDVGQAHVSLARAKALIQLRRSTGEVEAALNALVTNIELRPHVSWSAARWLIRLLDEWERHIQAAAVLDELHKASGAKGEYGDVARRYVALVTLDRALRANDASSVGGALSQLSELQPGIIAHLTTAAGTKYVGEFVARMFPY